MKKLILISIGICFFLTSCYYNNLIEIHPGRDLSLVCDSNPASITYQKTIRPILSSNCGTNNSCHNASASNPHLDTYEGVRKVAAQLETNNKSKIVNAINHTGPTSPMPKNSNTVLPRCARAQIELWVAAGFPDN